MTVLEESTAKHIYMTMDILYILLKIHPMYILITLELVMIVYCTVSCESLHAHAYVQPLLSLISDMHIRTYV